MDEYDAAWQWYTKNIAYKVDKTGCILSLASNGERHIKMPDTTPLDKAQQYFGIVLTGRRDNKDGMHVWAFDYAV